jgi:outer membrane protein insertion porin family
LRSFYQDQGFLEFSIESTQVSISPNKADVDITITVSEGRRYTISSISLAGDLAVDESEIQKMIRLKTGAPYSRAKLQAASKNIGERLGAEGYAFANVNAVPEINKEEGTVAFTFYIDPGRRVYVRKINISGNIKTRDEVIRREVRQMEGAWYDGPRIERSKVRIRRLGYFDDVNIETPPVAGSPDQVDLNITVVERNTGQFLVGVGYSSADKIALQASISQQNVFGSGNSLTIGMNTSASMQNYSMYFTDPYWTVNGVSRTVEVYKTYIDTSDLAVSYYKSNTLGAAVSFGVPITETDTISLGVRLENTKLEVDATESPQAYIDFVKEYGRATNNFMLSSGWTRDTRDDITFPSRGRLQTIYSEVAVPPGDLTYWKVQYVHQWFWPIYDPLVLMLRGEVGYADGFGGKPMPFFKAFYAGGVGSVRGYETSSLGPQDKDGNALSGRRKIVGNAEVFFPLIENDRSVRGSVFFDVGQIYQDGQQSDNEAFHYSSGFGVAWNSPIGAIKVSYGYPIAKKPHDRVQNFQFQLGSVF